MATLPTITDVYRIAYMWAGITVQPVNVIHVKVASTPPLDQIALHLGNAHALGSHSGFEALHTQYSCASVEITPLDGHTAGQVLPLGRTLSGTATGDPILNVACIVSLKTAQRGARGRGRIYTGPVGESATNQGTMDVTVASNVLSGWQSVHAALRADPLHIDPVVASYKHSDSNTITSIRVDNFVGSQRRRLDHAAHR